MASKKSINPFYLLLLIAGTAFAITAMAYGVMTVRGLQASRLSGYHSTESRDRNGNDSEIAEPSGFDQFMDRNGARFLIAELVLLAIGTFGAIAYDQHLDRKSAFPNDSQPKSEHQS